MKKDLELLKFMISNYEELINDGVDVRITFDSSAGVALVSEDKDGTCHFKPTGVGTDTIKVRINNWKPIND